LGIVRGDIERVVPFDRGSGFEPRIQEFGDDSDGTLFGEFDRVGDEVTESSAHLLVPGA
jgi:hypothetical protein